MLHGHTVPEPHQDVVGFDVSMKDVAALEEFEGQEELLAVRAHCLDVEPHIFTILLQDLPQVHARTGSYVYATFIHYWETKSHRSSKFLKGLPFLSNFFKELLLTIYRHKLSALFVCWKISCCQYDRYVMRMGKQTNKNNTADIDLT